MYLASNSASLWSMEYEPQSTSTRQVLWIPTEEGKDVLLRGFLEQVRQPRAFCCLLSNESCTRHMPNPKQRGHHRQHAWAEPDGFLLVAVRCVV